MSLNEFELIRQFFKPTPNFQGDGIVHGIGDDCAILDVPDGYQLAVSTDSLVSGIHFFADVDPYRLGYKALAVNLSDLAAMGATPKWASLAITLPEVDSKWLSEFSRGFFDLAKTFNVSLVGGDTTKGPLSITVSVKGIVSRGKALLRKNADVGDMICVSGNLGNGGLGLACKLQTKHVNNQQIFIESLELTRPRIELGLLLSDLASSCIDISDGLIQDLQHILNASECSANIVIDKLPLSQEMLKEVELATITNQEATHLALRGGDDYELLFTISTDKLIQLKERLALSDISRLPITVIGEITTNSPPVVQLYEGNKPVFLPTQGWDHFKLG